MAKRKRDFTEREKEITRERDAKLAEIEEAYKLKWLCGLKVHSLVFMIAVVSMISNLLGCANALIKDSNQANDLAAYGTRTVINLLLLVGNRKKIPWLYFIYIVGKTVRVIALAVYTLYLIGVIAKLYPHVNVVDRYVGWTDPAKADPERISIILTALVLIILVMSLCVYVVYRGYNYLVEVKDAKKQVEFYLCESGAPASSAK